jgi:hypothetical protein
MRVWPLPTRQVYPNLPLHTMFTGVISGALRPVLPPDAPTAWCGLARTSKLN